MDPSIPVDVVEHIIDQAADDYRLLCQLTLTCSQFLPRSRYHLLARHVCLRTLPHLEEFCAYLHANPHMRPIIRVVKLQIHCDMSEKKAPETLLSTMLVPLLLLPDLRYLGIQPFGLAGSYLLAFRQGQLARFETHTTSITTLDMRNVSFLDAMELMRFLSACPALRSLRLHSVNLQDGGRGMIFGPDEERPAKQLHLTSLEIGLGVHQSVMVLLLELGQSSVEALTLPPLPRHTIDGERIHNLMCGMQALRSITITIRPIFHSNVIRQVLVEAWEMMLRLPASPPRIHTISVPTLGHLDIALAKEPSVEKSRQLEQFFLGQTSHSIVFTASGTKRRRKAFWTTTLSRYFPKLHERGRLMIQGDDSSDAYDMTGHDFCVSRLAVSSDSKWIASVGSWDTTIILWDARRGSIVREWLTDAVIVLCLAFSPDSHLLASGCGDRSIAIWDVKGRNRIATLDRHKCIVFACAWSLDGTLLVSGDRNGGVRVWDTQSFTQLRSFDSHMRQCQDVRFSPDGRWLSFSRGTECKIWDTANGRMCRIFHAGGMAVEHTSFDPLSKRIAITGTDEEDTVCIWDIEAGKRFLVLDDKDISCAVAFSPNGDWVLSASKDRTAKIWNSHTGEQILSFKGHTSAVCSACFSPDGKYVASASVDRTVRLWRTHDGSCIKTFTEHTGWVTHVLFSPDGQTLCSGATDSGTVFIRDIRDIVS